MYVKLLVGIYEIDYIKLTGATNVIIKKNEINNYMDNINIL